MTLAWAGRASLAGQVRERARARAVCLAPGACAHGQPHKGGGLERSRAALCNAISGPEWRATGEGVDAERKSA
jgi:hypothetical protein